MSLADDDDGHATDDADSVVFEVDVLECNLESCAVFRLCRVNGIGTMAGIFWTGIDPQQIRSALLLLRIHREAWPEIANDVEFMGSVVAEHRNTAVAARSRNRGKR